MTEKEFIALLKTVPGSHREFVSGVVNDAREFGTMEEITRFICENPDKSAGYVVEHSTKLAGLI